MKNELLTNFFDTNDIDVFIENDLNKNFKKNKRAIFFDIFKFKKNFYGVNLSKEDIKKRKKQIFISCVLVIFALASIGGATVAIIKAKETSVLKK